MNLREFFTPAAIAMNWEEAATNRIPYLGAGLFPAMKKAGLDLSWLKGANGLPVSLMPSAFDAKATFRDRVEVVKLETEMPFFREGFKIKEKDRQELLRVRDANDPYAVAIIENIFNDAANLVEGAEVVAERMRMQLLFPVDGDVKIAIKANGVDYEYNYDTDGAWKTSNYIALSGGDMWSEPETSDPFKALEEAKGAIENKGSEGAVAIMNKNTFRMMAKAAAIKNRYVASNGMALSYLTDAEVKRVVEETVGVKVAVYNKMYRDESKAAHHFVPDGYVSVVPEGSLGKTVYGTTPEEADLIGASDAEVSIVNTGVAITRTIDPHPVNINIFASEIVLPSFERMDEVAVLKVAE